VVVVGGGVGGGGGGSYNPEALALLPVLHKCVEARDELSVRPVAVGEAEARHQVVLLRGELPPGVPALPNRLQGMRYQRH